MATNAKKRTATARRPVSRKSIAGTRGKKNATPGRAAGLLLPIFLSVCLLVCLIAVFALGYSSVTASNFFNVKTVEIQGVERSPKVDIDRIVRLQTEKSGVWNADLADIKTKIEQLPFVKNAAVSRVLPSGIRVWIKESEPKAIVRIKSGDRLVDADGNDLAPLKTVEATLPFALIGWDEGKTENAVKENAERVKLYQKMLSEWKQFDLVSRVKGVDLSDIREPKAIAEDSGQKVSITLGREDFGEHLKNGIRAIVGKGETFEAVELLGTNMTLVPRKAQPQAEQK